MSATGPDSRTHKARQVRAEKRTLADVLQALEDLIGRELGDQDGVSSEQSAAPTPPTPETPKSTPPPVSPRATQGELWGEDIPVLRDVVLARPATEAPPAREAERVRAIVHRAVAAFNVRHAGHPAALSDNAREILEHLLFEAWTEQRADASDEGPAV